uniref:NADH-ubiquinone oxidoreductase chain 2 n=1 Tax=Nymphes myrmeleonoides TaxID=560922 RepID=A0A088CAR6_NYMMY|nr:NADH dehydrogenase subunit 2 [Nymphes myrmeleonoides]AHY39211.1 NADH dehydrogenase subunit 2 [Nymphes myrmeleonoides]
MFKNFSLFLFFTTLISGSLISISANSWLGAWIGLEINLLSFIPLISNMKNSTSTESSLKYFIVQALASSILLFSVLILSLNSNFWMEFNMSLNLILNSSLLLKMGAAPFHSWFPEVMEGLSWLMNFILMTWQKLAPMILISYCFFYKFLYIIIIISIIIGSLGGLNQTNLRSLMAYSSINHLGWMLSSMMISFFYWFIYYLFYTLLSFSIIYMFFQMNIYYFTQIFTSLNYNMIMKFIIFCNFLSLGGLPPFTGFLPKWIIIQSLAMDNMFLMTLMVVFTLITLFFYIRLTYTAFMLNTSSNKFYFNLKFNNLLFLLMNFISLFGLIFIIMIYKLM